jgi:hypothetical protein
MKGYWWRSNAIFQLPRQNLWVKPDFLEEMSAWNRTFCSKSNAELNKSTSRPTAAPIKVALREEVLEGTGLETTAGMDFCIISV